MMDQDKLIDTDDLEAFKAVATKLSFSQAAAELGTAQSTISQRISRLEKRTGRRLIRRTTRSVELTPDGESMLIYARSILAIAEDARMRLRNPPFEGVLKIGMEDEFANTNLPRILGIFRSQHPNFELRFLTGRNEYLQDSLHTGDADIILGKSHAGRPGGEVIWREELVWAGAEPLVSKPIPNPIPLITYIGPSITRDLTEKEMMRAKRTWITVAQGSNLLGLLSAAEAGLGVMAIGRNFLSNGLCVVPESTGLPSLGTMDYVLFQNSGMENPAVSAFTEVLRGFMRQFAEK